MLVRQTLEQNFDYLNIGEQRCPVVLQGIEVCLESKYRDQSTLNQTISKYNKLSKVPSTTQGFPFHLLCVPISQGVGGLHREKVVDGSDARMCVIYKHTNCLLVIGIR